MLKETILQHKAEKQKFLAKKWVPREILQDNLADFPKFIGYIKVFLKK